MAKVQQRAQTISICGKGGSGKSTIVALLANEFDQRDRRVIVLDSDESNACLHWMLGFDEPASPLLELVGGKKTVQNQMKQSFTDDGDYSQMAVFQQPQFSVSELPDEYIAKTDGRVLITVGKIHQALEGCACPMGVMTGEFLKKLELSNDEVLLVDMEAGIEHFGRRVEKNIDATAAIVEPSLESIALAEKVKRLASEAGARFAGTIINKTRSADVRQSLKNKLQGRDIEIIGEIPYDERLFSASLDGQPMPSIGKPTKTIADRLIDTKSHD